MIDLELPTSYILVSGAAQHAYVRLEVRYYKIRQNNIRLLTSVGRPSRHL